MMPSGMLWMAMATAMVTPAGRGSHNLSLMAQVSHQEDGGIPSTSYCCPNWFLLPSGVCPVLC